MYKVIHFFTDLQDNDFAYEVGDTFPRKGKNKKKELGEMLIIYCLLHKRTKKKFWQY